MADRQHDPDTTFERFVHAEGSRLLRTATLLAHSEQAGQDLLQDALERVYRSWLKRPIEFPAAYTRTVMVRLLQRRRLLNRVVVERLDGHEVTTGNEVRRSDERSILFTALSDLPPRRRAAVVLRHWEGYSETETAEILGCSVGTVKSQTHRGLLALRTSCGPAFPGRAATPSSPPVSNLIGGHS